LAAVADAIMSSGLRIEASGGNSGLSFATVDSWRSTSSRACASSASAARMPGPPEFVNTAVRRERGRLGPEKAIAMSNNSSIDPARSTPVWASRASTAVSLAASAPVCDDAARAPAFDFADFNAMIGFARVMRDAISKNFRGLPKLSTYIRMTWTSGSFSQWSRRSLPLTFDLFPTDTNCENPIPYSAA
jgi:hypothetical protein